MNGTPPLRADLIRLLAEGLQDFEFVLAAWLEGADAHDRVDEFSDIDFWIDVLDGYEGRALAAVQKVLESKAPLELGVETEHPHPLIRQAFFRLQGLPEFLIVDLCVQSHSREFAFTEGKADEKAQVLFDRAGVVRFEVLDDAAFQASILERVSHLEWMSGVHATRVRKELARNNFLEALGAYHQYILEPLVEALRLRYEPTKGQFYLKHASADLPAETLVQLKWFFQVGDVSDIELRFPAALDLLQSELEEVRSVIEGPR